MSRADDAAFPIPAIAGPNGDWIWGAAGLTVREHFAAMAMQGLLANSTYDLNGKGIVSLIANSSVRMADTLIAELAKERS